MPAPNLLLIATDQEQSLIDRCCQSSANPSQNFADAQALGDEKFARFTEGRIS